MAATGGLADGEVPDTTDPVCRVRGLTVAYHVEPVLCAVDLDVDAGVVMGIVGPNGAGKSTLIKAMLGLVPALAGETNFFGQPLAVVRRRVSYVPQGTSVDPDFPATVRDVVLMGTYGRLGWLRRPGRAEREVAEEALAETGVADLAGRQLGELSGGQRQRVLLARALAQRADLLVMDEPFQGIDVRSQAAIIDVLRRQTAAGRTIVVVHHDLLTVRDHCDQVTLVNQRVVASGPVTEVFTPGNIARTYEVDSVLDLGGNSS
ncbi:MAG: metal ABC transporter ATP-binding protein [Propionibacteriaceae bacterium]